LRRLRDCSFASDAGTQPGPKKKKRNHAGGGFMMTSALCHFVQDLHGDRNRGLWWSRRAARRKNSAGRDRIAGDQRGPGARRDSAAPAAGTWTPRGARAVARAIAIYPDVVLVPRAQRARRNPQEVLDAGNWLVAHQDLKGDQIDAEAQKLGFSPSVRALLQFPETVDMMCMKMDWTTQLGQAFTADQAAVLDRRQRLRQQAKDVGNLKSSPQMAVETETQNDKEVVTVKPAKPDVVYVPNVRPVAVYAPPPATIPPPHDHTREAASCGRA
jgi:hypothetical protein